MLVLIVAQIACALATTSPHSNDHHEEHSDAHGEECARQQRGNRQYGEAHASICKGANEGNRQFNDWQKKSYSELGKVLTLPGEEQERRYSLCSFRYNAWLFLKLPSSKTTSNNSSKL